MSHLRVGQVLFRPLVSQVDTAVYNVPQVISSQEAGFCFGNNLLSNFICRPKAIHISINLSVHLDDFMMF